MNTKYLKFMFFLLVYLLIGTQAYAESIDVGSPYGYFKRSFISNTKTSLASDSYGNSNNDVHYRFRINAPTVLLVHHVGSELSNTSMYLLKKTAEDSMYTEICVARDDSQIEETKEIQKYLLPYDGEQEKNLAIILQNQAFICMVLEMGEYDLVCEGSTLTDGVNNGKICTTFSMLQEGMLIDSPIDLGTQGCCFSYDMDAHYNVGFTGKLPVYYRVCLNEPMSINVVARSNALIQAYVYDEQKCEMEHSYDGNITDMGLKAGIYYIYLTGYDKDIYLHTSITGVSVNTGNCIDVPVQITQSSKDGSISFDMSCNTTLYTDNYHGRDTNDMFFVLHSEDSISLQIMIHHFEMIGGLELTLMKGKLGEKTLFTIQQNDDIRLELSSGTYYLICEGVATNGRFGLSIEGKCYKESEQPGPEGPEPMENYSPTISLNYIQTITPMVSNDTISNFSYLSKAVHNIHYFDHLGRPVQEISYKFSPKKQDIVIHHEYDGLGRDSKQWLPVACTNKEAGAFAEQEVVSADARILYADDSAFSYSVYEDSPLNRVIESYGPGQAWQSSGHSNKNNYRINNVEDCCLFLGVGGTRDNPQLLQHGHYLAYELDVIETRDEDGHIKYSFMDKEGQLILSRNVADKDTLDTYYVYDDFGCLCFVLPPKAVDNLVEMSQDILDKYAYQYRYDYRHRCISKKMPDCDWIEQIYDHNNRLLFTQNGEQRKRNEWSFFCMDLLDRQVLTGMYRGTIPNREICDASDIYAVFALDSVNTYYGYRIQCPESILTNKLEILQVNYYDTYDYLKFLHGINKELFYVEDTKYGRLYDNQQEQHCKDLLTGNITLVLGNGQKLYHSYYYDYYRNLIQERHTTVNGKTLVYKSNFNFSGQPIDVCKEYATDAKIQKSYVYDHAGRLTREVSIIGNDTTDFVYCFDEIGRLDSLIRINGTDSLITTNDYNIRGWLTEIDSPFFRQKLHYTDGMGVPCYNGNVSSTTWQNDASTTRGYRFSYDGLSRLKDAIYGEGEGLVNNCNRFNEKVTSYDKMGNILGLKRYGQTAENSYGLIDNLFLTYNGNQLQAVNDDVTSIVSNYNSEFKDGAKQSVEYSYDSNGNLIQDLNKKMIEIQYNCLNLPSRIQFEGGNSIAFLYDANGTKIRTTHIINGVITSTDYCDNAIYENGVLDKLLTGEGYITLSDTVYHYFLRDHQGNNRVVVSQDRTVEEVNHYYPFGGVFASDSSVQPYKYNGKELDRRNGLDWYDYGARMYDPILGRFMATDPLYEMSYSENPYTYCLNNPFNRVDPTGMVSHYNWKTHRYEDENGNEVSWEQVKQEYMPEKESKVERTEDNYSQEISLVNTFLVPWGNAAALHAGLKYTEHPFGKGYFRTKKGKYFSMNIFHQPEGTKLARKAKGLVNSAKGAKDATKIARGLGNVVGVVSTAMSGYLFYNDPSVRNGIDISMGIISFFYWQVGVASFVGSSYYDTSVMNYNQKKENLKNGVNPIMGTFNFQTGRYDF